MAALAGGVAAIVVGSVTAQAGPSYPQAISGSFSGVFTGGYGELAGATGDPVTGTFSVDDSRCDVPHACDVFGSVLVPVAMSLTVDVDGHQLSFGNNAPENGIRVTHGAGAETLDLLANYTNPYENALLSLVGAADAFVNGTNFLTLHPGAVTGADLEFMGGRELGGGADLTSVTIDGVPVPEPASWPLLLLALAGLGWAVRARPGATACPSSPGSRRPVPS